MMILAIVADNWSAIYGNLPKLTLAAVGLGFSILFMVQRFILYPNSSRFKDKVSVMETTTNSSESEYFLKSSSISDETSEKTSTILSSDT